MRNTLHIEPELGECLWMEIEDLHDHIHKSFKYQEAVFVGDIYGKVLDYMQGPALGHKSGHQARVHIQCISPV